MTWDVIVMLESFVYKNKYALSQFKSIVSKVKKSCSLEFNFLLSDERH
jgi:hypothetical protein